MARVNLEITGFYYRRVVLVDDAATTVKSVMDAAEALTGFPKLVVIPEAQGGFVKTLLVSHDPASAVSGQTQGDGSAVNRIYPAGVYVGQDDPVERSIDETNPILTSPTGLTQVRAWQYYVYDERSVDINRLQGPRRIVPYTGPFPSDVSPRPFQDGDTVVWRQVTISVAPTFGSESNGIKSVVSA